MLTHICLQIRSSCVRALLQCLISANVIRQLKGKGRVAPLVVVVCFPSVQALALCHYRVRHRGALKPTSWTSQFTAGPMWTGERPITLTITSGLEAWNLLAERQQCSPLQLPVSSGLEIHRCHGERLSNNATPECSWFFLPPRTAAAMKFSVFLP